jgi:hypothetical protein
LVGLLLIELLFALECLRIGNAEARRAQVWADA